MADKLNFVFYVSKNIIFLLINREFNNKYLLNDWRVLQDLFNYLKIPKLGVILFSRDRNFWEFSKTQKRASLNKGSSLYLSQFSFVLRKIFLNEFEWKSIAVERMCKVQNAPEERGSGRSGRGEGPAKCLVEQSIPSYRQSSQTSSFLRQMVASSSR